LCVERETVTKFYWGGGVTSVTEHLGHTALTKLAFNSILTMHLTLYAFTTPMTLSGSKWPLLTYF